jgi:hypothetical protein
MKDSNRAHPDFYDVFISYRHADEEDIKALERKIRDHHLEPFRDLDFPNLKDPKNVTREKIETIRQALARATSLIFVYSRSAAKQAEPTIHVVDEGQGSKSSVGYWMPWELGFFDGSISARIGVYLLDTIEDDFDPKTYYRGAEYLQLYTPVSDEGREPKPGEGEDARIVKLSDFLAQNAVRERRVDNVASAFIWMENLFEECWANPTNVALGIAEWQADHIARFWEVNDNSWLEHQFRHSKEFLDWLRMTSVRHLRSSMIDCLFATLRAQRRLAASGFAELGNASPASAETMPDMRSRTERPKGREEAVDDTLQAMIMPWLALVQLPGRRAPTSGTPTRRDSGRDTGGMVTEAPAAPGGRP